MSEMDEVDALFDQLKNACTSQEGGAPREQALEHNEDIVTLEQDRSREQDFERIEKNLRQLPRLQNSFDKLDAPKVSESKSYALPKEKQPREGVTNEEWFSLPTPTGEFAHKVQRDLQLIKHRAALDPKRHYKKEKWKTPERFAVGTIVEDKSEFFSSRLPRRQRGETMLSSMLRDSDQINYLKRKYGEIQQQKHRGRRNGKGKGKGRR